jgi:hypothetical protein
MLSTILPRLCGAPPSICPEEFLFAFNDEHGFVIDPIRFVDAP